MDVKKEQLPDDGSLSFLFLQERGYLSSGSFFILSNHAARKSGMKVLKSVIVYQKRCFFSAVSAL